MGALHLAWKEGDQARIQAILDRTRIDADLAGQVQAEIDGHK